MKKKSVLGIHLFVLLLFFGICITPTFAQPPKKTSKTTSTKTKSVKKTYTKRKKAVRTRKDMILEVEMKALKEALTIKKDQERTNRFATKAEKEYTQAKEGANNAREMLQAASNTMSEADAEKAVALTAIEKARIAAEETRALSDKAKKNAKLAKLESATYSELREGAKQDVIRAKAREEGSFSVLERAKAKESYYRNLIKKRLKKAEDFYYIAEAAMKKGGNAQSMEFAIKAKSEMEQAKIAENEADIRAEATRAAAKVVEVRIQATESARVKSRSLVKLMALAEEISTALNEAYQAVKLSAQAAEKVLLKAKDFASSKDEIVTFSAKKLESLTSIKDASEKKELLASEAVISSQAVVAAKQKAQAEAEARARGALNEARTLIVKPTPVPVEGALSGEIQPQPASIN